MRLIRFLALLVAVLPLRAFAEDFTAKVISVANGDTIGILRDGNEFKVRLDGIDCPEIPQAYGDKAKQATSELALEKTVTVQVRGKDRDGRLLADVILPDGQNLNRGLVRSGLAWWYKQYSKDEALEKLESEARADRIGLWVDGDPTAPWLWREQATRVAGTNEPPLIPVEPNGVEIVALLPDPVKRDSGHEEVTLENSTGREVSLAGWTIKSDLLSGSIPAKSKRVIKLSKELLRNTGDDVLLIDREGVVRSLVSYSARNVKVGQEIEFQR